MERRDERELRETLIQLRAEHRQLDGEIVALEASATADQLLVKRLKKKKLILKDQITQIEDRLLPDIIA
ncbi:MAG: YdcH family protein [Hyphomicrobium sp.]